MLQLSFQVSAADPCLFSRGMAQNIVILCIHVDDGFMVRNGKELQRFFTEVKALVKMTTEESLRDYLSCKVKFNQDLTKAWLGQPHMIKKIEKVFGAKVAHLRVYKTPGTPGIGIERPKVDSDMVTAEEQSEYMSGIGMLLYLVKHSRPDIANAVRELTKCMSAATPAAYKEMYRLIKFVLCTKTWGLKIMPKPTGGLLKWNLVSFSDSDWAGDKDNRRSVNGFVLFLCGVPIVWRSKQQKTVALSSSEAKYVAISEAVKEILFVLQLLNTMNIPVEAPVRVRVDNMGAIFMAGNASSSVKTRHVDTRFHFVRELVEDKVVEIIFVKTDENKADGFTKNVRGDVFEEHVKDFIWNKDEVGSAALTHIHTEEELHRSSVGRVSEIQGDFGTDSRAGSFSILSGYSRNEESQPSLLEHKDPSFGVNRITKTGPPVDQFEFYM